MNAPTATCATCDRPALPTHALCTEHLDRAVLVLELDRLRARVAELERENRYLVGVAGRGR